MSDLTPRQMDAIAAWWQSGGSNVRAARLMGITPQVVRNMLMGIRRQEGADTNLALASRYMGQIAKRKVLLAGNPAIHKGRLTPEQNNAWRRFRYQMDPEYRENQKRQAVKGMRKLRESDPDVAARLERYAALVAVQGEVCAICGGVETRLRTSDGTPHRLAIDHDHENGKERALLCANCNLMLGSAADSPERLEAGAAYLRHHKASHNAKQEEAERAG